MSYARIRETGYYAITSTPPVVIGRSTWDLVCELPGHGPYLGNSWNQGCPACKAARAAARQAARDARFHERVNRVRLAGAAK